MRPTACFALQVVLSAAALASAARVVAAAPAPSPRTTTPAPTAAPGEYNAAAVASSRAIPEDERCVQTVKPPGVKPGSCMQVLCVPKSVQEGDTFNTTVRFCLQWPRLWHLTFGLLDEETKAFYGGEGYDNSDTPWQCAQHTFTHTLKADKCPGTSTYNLMWKYFALPVWGTPEGETVVDQFPNMLAEAGIAQQPDYAHPLSGDCPWQPTRHWNLPGWAEADGINWYTIPPCFESGAPFTTYVATRIKSVPAADLHVNLQVGTGGDKFLGAKDVYVTESDVYDIKRNTGTPAWTSSTVTFTAAQTAMVSVGDPIYLAAFLVPPDSQFNASLPGGWDYIQREFYTVLEYCPGAKNATTQSPNQ